MQKALVKLHQLVKRIIMESFITGKHHRNIVFLISQGYKIYRGKSFRISVQESFLSYKVLVFSFIVS